MRGFSALYSPSPSQYSDAEGNGVQRPYALKKSMFHNCVRGEDSTFELRKARLTEMKSATWWSG